MMKDPVNGTPVVAIPLTIADAQLMVEVGTVGAADPEDLLQAWKKRAMEINKK